jgi:BclB C-terminal domain-containing protein
LFNSLLILFYKSYFISFIYLLNGTSDEIWNNMYHTHYANYYYLEERMDFDKYLDDLFYDELKRYDKGYYDDYIKVDKKEIIKHKESLCKEKKDNKEEKVQASIIPYASGAPVELQVIQPNTTNANVGIVAFGNSFFWPVNVPSGTITIPTGGVVNFALTMPKTGSIKSIAADFTLSEAETISSGAVIIKTQLYKSFPPSNIFSAIPGTEVILTPLLTGIVPVGTIVTGIRKNIRIPELNEQTRLILVFSAVAQGAGATVSEPIKGFASAGVTIE